MVNGIDDFFSLLAANKDALSALSSLITVAVLGFAFFQYRRGENWKRTEFLAKLYREFADDPGCQRTMWMLDWSDRQINFGSDDKPNIVKCSTPLVCAALRKHDQQDGKEHFSSEEMVIRDTFDRFFMYTEQFERAMQNRI